MFALVHERHVVCTGNRAAVVDVEGFGWIDRLARGIVVRFEQTNRLVLLVRLGHGATRATHSLLASGNFGGHAEMGIEWPLAEAAGLVRTGLDEPVSGATHDQENRHEDNEGCTL